MNETTEIAVAKTDIKHMRESLARIEANSVSKARFRPVELITYGLTIGVMSWALTQFLDLLDTAKAFF